MKNKQIEIGERIENKIPVFIVVSKKSKKSIPEEWELANVDNPDFPKDLKIIMTFKSRRTAERWVRYWRDGENLFDVLERKLF